MKVYMVTSGSYSDYRVHHLFLKEDDAKGYIATKDRGYEYDYTEMDVHKGPVKRQVQWTARWYPTFNISRTLVDDEIVEDTEIVLRHKWDHWENGEGEQNILIVYGPTKEAVLKVYSEQRAIYLARKEGIS
jgi:hypothetical protein